MANPKRPRDSFGNSGPTNKRAASQPDTPIMRMFESFRTDLDAHHDRRERIVKASRDITAASKKMSTKLGPLKPGIQKEIDSYFDIIRARYNEVAPDLQGLDAARYASTITHGNQEFVEAISFLHYIETQTLITHQEANARLRQFFQPVAKKGDPSSESKPKEGTTGTAAPVEASSSETGADPMETDTGEGDANPDVPIVELSFDDYILGLFDLGGEVMRLAITTLGSADSEPLSLKPSDPSTGESTGSATPSKRTILDDIRLFRRMMEDVNFSRSSVGYHASKKMPVLQACVDKVEKALYGVAVRGAEMPPDRLKDMLRSTSTAVMVDAME